MLNPEQWFTELIIVDSTDPVGRAEGLFSADFYRDCIRALDNGGF